MTCFRDILVSNFSQTGHRVHMHAKQYPCNKIICNGSVICNTLGPLLVPVSWDRFVQYDTRHRHHEISSCLLAPVRAEFSFGKREVKKKSRKKSRPFQIFVRFIERLFLPVEGVSRRMFVVQRGGGGGGMNLWRGVDWLEVGGGLHS